jgi:hypothetical protein
MNNHFYNPDHIEAFLENKLSQAEKLQFRSAMEKDPLLKNEVALQEDIIESLKNVRRLELKNRLNNIDVALNPSYSGLKIAASVVLAGLIGWGIHSYLNSDTNGNDQKISNPSSELSAATENNSREEIIFKNEEAKNSGELTGENNNENKISSSKPSAKKSENPRKGDSPTSGKRPDLMDQVESESFQKEDNISLPEGKVAQIIENRTAFDVTVDKNSENKFHYKYHENKLFLYGNFDSKTYEILELNTYNGRQVYLLVDDNYYQLKANQLEPTPLQKITDKKLIGELNKFSGK